MKSERRHDLQTNALADWLGNKITAVQSNATWIVGGLLLLMIVVLFLFIRQNRLESVATTGWTRLQNGTNAGLVAVSQQQPLALSNATRDLEDLTREYAGKPVAAYAYLTLGDLFLQNGQAQYVPNKTAARDAFGEAARFYQEAAKHPASADMESRALFCLGKSLEWQLKLNQAKDVYGKVEGPYQLEAQARIRNLDQKGTEAFYKQYAEWKPKQEPTRENRYGELDFELEDQAAPSSNEIDAALKAVVDGSGVEDAAEEAESGGGEAPPAQKDETAESGGGEAPPAQRDKTKEQPSDTTPESPAEPAEPAEK